MPLDISGEITPERMNRQSQSKTTPSCGCDWQSKQSPMLSRTILHRNLNVRSMSHGVLEVVEQEMARVNIDILGISELKWTGMGKLNSDDHYIYYCGQESLRRNGIALIVNKRV